MSVKNLDHGFSASKRALAMRFEKAVELYATYFFAMVDSIRFSYISA
jgi:hypothetical protein